MKVVVDGTADRPTVDDAENLEGLSVELRNCTPVRAAALLDGLGRLDGEHAWLDIEVLRELSPTPRSCSWDERFTQAMAYAKHKGWTDPTGAFVRAHLAPNPGQPG